MLALCSQACSTFAPLMVADTTVSDGRTALEVVFLAQNWDILRDEKGVGTKRPSTDGENTLEVAIQARDWEGVRILVAFGANLDAILQGMAVLSVVLDLMSKRHFTIPGGQAAYEVIFNLGGWGCVCIVEGWNTNSGINGPRKDVQTAFEVWVHARRWGRVPFLVGLGANINAVFKDGQTALDVATRAEDWEGVHVLAGLKPSVNTHFQDRSTVSKVVREEKWNLILEIIDAGADVNMPVNGTSTSPKQTPLATSLTWAPSF
ncbi:hypothetical protein FA13DRAFT_1165639 [Coprinellus micaceus]|uniref:Ankyrin n=1 Tax=Coprinellus micaceus TaxID=71717 RepID=A0A4Y7SU11_COPMI|nr:hypothetical protein FA13DRAFT_1165639 [Coprinellus micaceus]